MGQECAVETNNPNTNSILGPYLILFERSWPREVGVMLEGEKRHEPSIYKQVPRAISRLFHDNSSWFDVCASKLVPTGLRFCGFPSPEQYPDWIRWATPNP